MKWPHSRGRGGAAAAAGVATEGVGGIERPWTIGCRYPGAMAGRHGGTGNEHVVRATAGERRFPCRRRW